MGLTDPNKLTEDLASGYQEKQKQKNLAKKYVAYEGASEERKKRIATRDQNKQDRYADSKARLEAKRERYADKMVGKGLIENRDAAMNRFDSLRNITVKSSEKTAEILGNFGKNKKESQQTEETEVIDPTIASIKTRFDDPKGFGSFTV